jgi:hypothetical protein
LLQRKKQQLEGCDNFVLLPADLVTARNECTKFNEIFFLNVEFDGPFKKVPPIKNLRLEITGCRLPMLEIIPLTLFAISYACWNINDLTNKIIMKCPVLMNLDLKGNSELRCRALRNTSTCKMLNYLVISICRELHLKAIKYVAENCLDLQHLDV